MLAWRTVFFLTIAAVVAWSVYFTLPDGRLHVSFMDVGEGDAILVRTPSHKVLIDGGPSPQALTRELGRILPFWDRRIDLVVLTHPHEDHLMGLMEVLQRYDVGAIFGGAVDSNSSLYRQWRTLAQSKGIEFLLAREGQLIRLDREVTLEVLASGETPERAQNSAVNNSSVVLRLAYGSFSVLLAGDLEEDGQRRLSARGVQLNAAVLKVPHQGASNALNSEFLDQVRPAVAVILVGQDNPYGHPAAQTLAKLQGTKLYRTDRDGTIEVDSDGRAYQVRPARLRQ